MFSLAHTCFQSFGFKSSSSLGNVILKKTVVLANFFDETQEEKMYIWLDN